MELKTVKEMVEKLLKENLILRGDDDLLFCEICRQIKPETQSMSVCEFFLMRKKMGLPSFESVSRCRRKAQEEINGLKPCERVQESRKRQEEKFYNFATKQAEFSF